jgi:hypothetical protein
MSATKEMSKPARNERAFFCSPEMKRRRPKVAEALLRHLEKDGAGLGTIWDDLAGATRFIVMFSTESQVKQVIDLSSMEIKTIHPDGTA